MQNVSNAKRVLESYIYKLSMTIQAKAWIYSSNLNVLDLYF